MKNKSNAFEISYETIQASFSSPKIQEKIAKVLYFKIGKWVTKLLPNTRTEIKEDITSEIVVKIFQKMHTYKPDFSFNTWAYKVAKNHVIDYLRKNKLDTLSLNQTNNEDEEVTFELHSTLDTQDIIMAKQETNEFIQKLMNSTILSDKQKELFVLRFIQDKPYDEIASKLDVPLGTVKAWIHRIREIVHLNHKMPNLF